ncbi:MAG: glutamate-5-semialdehyde dehydrogenase [Nitrospira sp. UW-LDO-01]|nr:MAG: glutamate-5-semialdehyde dehydrogenase [Nitrospira sp. UW-LDO-01]
MAIDVPAKLYIEKLLKDSRSIANALGILPGSVKTTVLHAMAERVASDHGTILTANAKDVEAVGKSFGEGTAKERMKAAVAHVRVTAEQLYELVEQLHQIAELPDPVGLVVSRQERPDGLLVSRVKVPIGVLAVLSERNPLVSMESIALGLKSGNFCILRGAPEWRYTHQAIDAGLREAAVKSGVPAGAWVLIDRPDKDVALELMRSAKAVDALIVRGGAGLRKAVAEQAKVPVLCDDGGVTHLYIDGDSDIPMAQNLVINSKVQQPGASNSLDTLLVQQVIGRQFLPPVINRLLDEFKVEVHACPKTVALMGQMAMTGHTAIVPATEADWRTQFAGPTLAIKMVEGLDEALAHIAAYRPCLTAVIATNRYESAMRFTREVDAGAVLVNASTRLHAGEAFGMGRDMGLSVGKLHAKGPIGLEQLTCEKYVAFGSGQLRLPHPVPETYFDAIMLKRP